VKLPAVAITAAFACGVALGLCPPLVRLAISHFWLAQAFLPPLSGLSLGSGWRTPAFAFCEPTAMARCTFCWLASWWQ
jgi:hypothetical protein